MRQLNVLPFAIVESLGHVIKLPAKDETKNTCQINICYQIGEIHQTYILPLCSMKNKVKLSDKISMDPNISMDFVCYLKIIL